MGRLRAVGTVLAVLAVAACGGDSGKVDVAVVGKGAAATIASRSFRFEVTLSNGDGRPEVMSGSADLAQSLAWMGEGRGDAVEPEFIVVGDRYYQASFRLPHSAGATTPWVLHDFAAEQARLREASACSVDELIVDLEAGKEIDVDAATAPGSVGGLVPDPSRMLRDLRSQARSVDAAGSGEVRGVDTRIYDVVLRANPAATGQTVPEHPEQTPEMRRMEQELLDALSRPPKTRVWIDDADLVRRIEYRQELPQDAVNLTRFEFFDFGTKVTVEEPAAADVTPFLSLPRPFGDLGCIDSEDQLRSVGAWAVARDGELGGRRWMLETGTSSDGASCVRLRTDPPLDHFEDVPAEPDVPEFEEGTCSSEFTSAGITWDGDFNSIYGVAPPGADAARAKYKGGRTGEVVTVGDFWLVVWDESRELQSVEFLRKGRVLDVCDDIDKDDGPTC